MKFNYCTGVLGLYSGIFAMYLKCQWDKSRKPTIVLYALCLLYVLSTVTVASDLVVITLQLVVSNKSTCKNIIF